MTDYIHVPGGTEINLLSVIIKVSAEGYLAYQNRSLLYIEGMTTVGSACCGNLECRIIYVPGFVVSRHYKTDNASGNPVSIVEPVTDPSTLENVKNLFYKTFPQSLFLFS